MPCTDPLFFGLSNPHLTVGIHSSWSCLSTCRLPVLSFKLSPALSNTVCQTGYTIWAFTEHASCLPYIPVLSAQQLPFSKSLTTHLRLSLAASPQRFLQTCYLASCSLTAVRCTSLWSLLKSTSLSLSPPKTHRDCCSSNTLVGPAQAATSLL